MSYYSEKPIYQQVKKILAENPKLSRKEALSMVTRGDAWSRSNAVRPHFKGDGEVARRKRQIAKGFIKVN